MLSQGVPMLVIGDECRRTQKGNNNAYCQDNDISLVRLGPGRAERGPGALRLGPDQLPPQPADGPPRALPHRQAAVRRRPARRELVQRAGHGRRLARRRLDADRAAQGGRARARSRRAGPRRAAPGQRHHASRASSSCRRVAKGTRWRLFLDTAAAPPYDVYPDLDGPPPPRSRRLTLSYRSMCVFVADKRRNGK